MRRLLAAIVLVGGPIVYLARRRGERRETVQLHYDDGSSVTIERGAAGAERLLGVARTALIRP